MRMQFGRRIFARSALALIERVVLPNPLGITVRMATAPGEIEQAQALNVDTYARELAQESVEAAEGFGAKADGARYVIAKRGDEVVGMLVIMPPGTRFSIEDSLDDPRVVADNRHCSMEVRRLAVKPHLRGAGVYFRLCAFTYSYAIERGIKHIFLSARAGQTKMYADIGAHVIGRPFTKGHCEYVPMRIRAELGPAYFAWRRLEKLVGART